MCRYLQPEAGVRLVASILDIVYALPVSAWSRRGRTWIADVTHLADGVAVAHVPERRRQRHTLVLGPDTGHEALNERVNVVRRDEGHFQVDLPHRAPAVGQGPKLSGPACSEDCRAATATDLGELGLAVGAQVLVAEALGDLKVPVQPGGHEHLLVLGRRMGGPDAIMFTMLDRACARPCQLRLTCCGDCDRA